MSAIPVPVHFDGHNINIITEDSPSTCKNRTKGLNYGKKNNNKNKRRNNQNGKSKIQMLNKRLPNSNSNQNRVKSPISHSSNNTDSPKISPPNITPSNKENIDELNPNQTTIKKQSCPLPIVPKIKDNNNNNSQLPTLPSLPLPPPSLPSQVMNASIIPNTNRKFSKNNALIKQAAHGHPMTVPLSKQEIIAEQNRQLLATGLDPAEFGSHDDVGFDDDNKRGNGNNGKDRQNLYKTELCREWSTSGWCYYNKRCSFAHGLQELRPVFRSKKWRTKRCRNWHTTGYCPYEHRCQFLHDQSPPRRISDYATANARALVAAQQRMQPLYFHYQVDCNRDETSDDDADKKSNHGTNSKPNTPILMGSKTTTSPHTQSIGPRFKSGKIGKRNMNMNMNVNNNGNINRPKTPKTPNNINVSNGNMNNMNAMNAMNMNIMNMNMNINGAKRIQGQIRMIPQRKNNKKNKNKNKRNKQIKPNTPKGINQNNKLKKKKQKKDAVITPFNPVTNTYAGGVNINLNNINNMNGMTHHTATQLSTNQSYEIAAQQLGLYNPIMSSSIAAAAAAMGGIMPPLPMTTMPSTFQPLPPSIDPSLYLSLTPSPPQSPRTTHTHPHTGHNHNKKMKIKDDKSTTSGHKLNVEVPVSLTPSPPSLPIVTPVHPIHSLNIGPTINNINNINGNAAALSHQQIGIELVKQQQTLAALHEKVQRVAQQQAAQQAEQQAAVQALLARNVINKSNTPIAPIDGGLLESLLPTNDRPNNNNTSDNNNKKVDNTIITNDGNKSVPQIIKSSNNKAGNKTTQTQSVPNTTNNSNKKDTTNTKTLPPIPPIPPPLQLQTSINSVVTGAVAAAMMNSTPNAVKHTPNSINNTTFGFNNINVNVALNPGQKISKLQTSQPMNVAVQSIPNNPTNNNNAYVQQAHAHAHAYATQHSKINNNIVNQTNPISAYSYANYPSQISHIPVHHNPHHTINSLPQIQPLQQLSNLQPMQPIQTHIGYPPFYAPSPDFQEISIPQQQYYNANYTHHQVQRHQPY